MWEQCRDVSTDTQGCRDESMQDVGMCTYKDAGMLRAPSGVTSPQCHTRGEGGRSFCLWSCILLLTICSSEMGLCLSSISTFYNCLPCSGSLPMELRHRESTLEGEGGG